MRTDPAAFAAVLNRRRRTGDPASSTDRMLFDDGARDSRVVVNEGARLTPGRGIPADCGRRDIVDGWMCG